MGADHVGRHDRTLRRRLRSEALESALIVALASLVLFKGGPVIAGIAFATAEMMAELLRVLTA